MNPEIARIRERLRPTPPDPDWTEMRRIYDKVGSRYLTAEDVTVVPATANGVEAEWTQTPQADVSRVIIHLHGGGYVIGSVVSHRHMVSELGRAAGTRTLALNYRLAPENPFPAAIEDTVASYRYLLDQGIAAPSIAISGDSAGGGLAISSLLAIRDAGLPQPSCCFTISPWIDLEGLGESIKTKAQEDPITMEYSIQRTARDYLGGADPRTPLAAPLYANFEGLCPQLIHVGSTEIMLDDAVRLARLAGAAGVDTRLEIWPEMLHVWHWFHPELGEGRRALRVAGDFIRQQMDRCNG